MNMKKKFLSFLLAATLVIGAVVPATPSVIAQGTNEPTVLQATDEDGDGLFVGKTANKNDDGSYTISMEAYTTGEVKTEVKDVPLDIVLVLDQSGSMNDPFGSTNRQEAMKTAVKNFIDNVGKQYSAEADHRLSLVKFESSASILLDWTFADESGTEKLKKTVSGLRAGGATNVGDGMKKAETLMTTGYNYNGANTKRQKVVIVFTDGVPTTQSDFDIGVANTAISSALRMKQSGVTIYSVGIFDGAAPDVLHGPTHHSLGIFEIIKNPCSGEVGSIFNTNITTIFGDIKAQDVPAGNRFLNFLSSNFMTADEIGIKKKNDTFLGIGFYGYQITKNFSRDSRDYYLTATDEEGLNNVFETISNSISNPSIDLDAETVVKDVISPYFNVPANVADIKLYTADYNGTAFEDRKEVSGVTASIAGDTVSVTGFDFNKNFVSNDLKPDTNDYGRKLIIEFTVKPKEGFLGGNHVPTNGEKSGVYTGETVVDNFPVPTVDVPIGDITVTPKEKNIYLKGSLTSDEARKDAIATVGGVVLNLDPTAANYGLESWQNEFVNISVDTEEQPNLTDDSNYKLTVTVIPKEQGTMSTKSDFDTANINVFKPEVTWRDSQINAGETVNYENQNFVKAEWKHGETFATSVKMVGNAPELAYEYTPKAGAFNTEQKVNVTVKVNGSSVNDNDVVFKHETCNFAGCTFNPEECEFIVHIKSFDLTITKNGCKEIDENQSFVFTVTGDNGFSMQVVIKGNSSKTIKNLPAGNYTVTEDVGWSWRYTPESRSQEVTAADIQNGKAIVDFNNTRATQGNDGTSWKWLNGCGYKDNHFNQ